ncbi:MAG: EexN family lipoprotein [Gammaproteobacteria bacterium]|nr:EexN family lipoprotein [Gammaproteobacteria bacterium]
MTMHKTALFVAIGLVAGCAPEEPPARTTTEFVDNPMLLEAAMVRCQQNRRESRYDQECINAREAVKRIQAKEEETRREELEARSQRKREALRRTQQAAAEARRRAEEAERLRKEAEYLAQFGVLPPTSDGSGADDRLPEGNLPLAVIPETGAVENGSSDYGDVVPPSDGGNAPSAGPAQDAETTGDLDAVREELRRRGDVDQQG